MHSLVRPVATKILAWLACAAGLALLSGCDAVTLTDLTPKSMAENPSQIYTFSLRIAKRTGTVVGLTPNIVVDGKSFEMKPSPLGGGLHEFEYQLPAGRDRLAYYFLVTYNVEGN
ncbi:MAG: cell surface protein, partial [Verrucomicrobiota bacterium]